MDKINHGEINVKRWLIIIISLSILFRISVIQPTWMQWDENYYINIFQNFVDRGELTPYMWRLGADTNIIAGSGTGYGIYILLGWMSIFGESLVSVRALMIIAGSVSAWLYYLISKKWWGSETAGIAALVYGLVSTNAFFSLVGRMDALANLSYSLLLFLHIYAVRQEKKWPHLLVGAAAILTVEIHVLGLFYLCGLAVYYGIEFGKTTVSEKKLILNSAPVYFFLGTSIFGVLYIIVHILPDPQAYFLIPSTCDICLSNRLQSAFVRIQNLRIYRPVDIIITSFVIFTAIKQKNFRQHYLKILLGYFLAQIIFNPPPYVQYSQHLTPLIAIGVGGTIADLLSRIQTEKQTVTKQVFLLVALLILGYNWISFTTFTKLPFPNAYWMPQAAELAYIQEFVPESTVVMASARYFYPLKNYRNFFASDSNLNYGISIRGESMDSFLTRIHPKVILENGDVIKNDPIIEAYITKNNLMMVTENLWVTEDLFQDSEITR